MIKKKISFPDPSMDDKRIPTLDVYPNFQQRLSDKRGFRRLLLTALPAIPRHAYHPFLHEVHNALCHLRSRPYRVLKAYSDRRNLLVNLGCGLAAKPGWVNVDMVRYPEVNYLFDCRKKLPFSDCSVRAIFTEHFIEHIDYCEEIPAFLSECHRVLLPGGVIRIIVPDAEKYVRGYCSEDWCELSQIRPLGADHSDSHFGTKYSTKMELLNVVFRQYFEHKFAYDFETLEFVLRRYGFSQVEHQKFGRSVLPELAIDNPSRASESLYVEAVK